MKKSENSPTVEASPVSMISWPNVRLLLGQCRRQWANSKPTLGQRLAFAGALRGFDIVTKSRRCTCTFKVITKATCVWVLSKRQNNNYCLICYKNC